MPDIEDDLPETCVLWEKTGIDEHNDPILAQPVEIPCRWEERRTETMRRGGTPTAFDATVFVDRFIPEGSLMWRGDLKSAPTDAHFSSTSPLMQVKLCQEVPDYDARAVQRSVGLMRFRDALTGVT